MALLQQCLGFGWVQGRPQNIAKPHCEATNLIQRVQIRLRLMWRRTVSILSFGVVSTVKEQPGSQFVHLGECSHAFCHLEELIFFLFWGGICVFFYQILSECIL